MPSVTILFISSYVRDDLYVEDRIKVSGIANFEKFTHFHDEVRFDGLVRLTDGETLSNYIDDRIKALVKAESLK